LKTRPKQLLGSLPLDIALPGQSIGPWQAFLTLYNETRKLIGPICKLWSKKSVVNMVPVRLKAEFCAFLTEINILAWTNTLAYLASISTLKQWHSNLLNQLRVFVRRHDTQHNDTQHNNKYQATLNIIFQRNDIQCFCQELKCWVLCWVLQLSPYWVPLCWVSLCWLSLRHLLG
jgi:hypothetical protein